MRLFKKVWPFLLIVSVWLVLFRPFWLKGLLPIPADIIAGVYYPWLDYKWGFAVGVPVKNPLMSDVPSLLYPWRSFAIDELKAGRWPLWNPYYFGGMPLLANFQSAVFSYVNVFFLFFSKPIAWSLGVMASPILIMLAMYWFLRTKRLDKIPSLFGAITFSLSGFQIAWLEYNVLGHTVLFFILILLAVEKIFNNPGNKRTIWWLLLPLFVAFQIFTGYPPIIIYSYLIIFLYILFFYFVPGLVNKNIKWNLYFKLGFLFLLGLMMSSVQLFPGLELARNSIRLIDPAVSATKASFLPFWHLITAVVPDYFGNPASYNYFGKGFFDNYYFFIGTGTMLLSLLSLCKIKKDKNILFWGGCLSLSLVMVFDNFIGHFLQKALFLSGGVASRALFITDFSLAVLASYGLHKLLKKEYSWKRVILFSLLFIVIFILLFGNAFYIENQVNRMVALRNLVLPSLVLLFSIIGVILLSIKRIIFLRFKPLVAFSLLLLVTIQLLYSAGKYLPFSKSHLIYPKTPVIDFLLEEQKKNKEPFRVGINDVIPQNFLMPYGLEAASGYDALLPKRTGEFIMALITGNTHKQISRVQFISNFDSPLFPLFNIKYDLAKKLDEEGKYTPKGKIKPPLNSSRFKLLFEDKTVAVLEDSKVLPRAFLVGRVKTISTIQDFIDLTKNGFDFSKTIILEENPENFTSPQPVSGEIEWLDNKPDGLRIRVKTDYPAFVFMGNNYYPGWEAFIDEKPARILRANYTFQAIEVPEGEHLLHFRYKPKSFLYGGLLSFFSFANWFILFVLLLVKHQWVKRK